MSDERRFGIDMVPAAGMPFHEEVPANPVPVPATEAERHEYVNADVLRRACHVRMDELIAQVRKLPPRAPINVRNLVRLAAQDLETAVEHYLGVERTFRRPR